MCAWFPCVFCIIVALPFDKEVDFGLFASKYFGVKNLFHLELFIAVYVYWWGWGLNPTLYLVGVVWLEFVDVEDIVDAEFVQ